MQVVGIALEEGVQNISRFSGFRLKQRPPPLWVRVLGRIWLILFLVWTIPAWVYPALCRRKGGTEGSTLPFSFFALFTGRH